MKIEVEIVVTVVVIIAGMLGYYLKSLRDDIKSIAEQLSKHIKDEDARMDKIENEHGKIVLLTSQHEATKTEHCIILDNFQSRLSGLEPQLTDLKNSMRENWTLLKEVKESIHSNAIGNDMLQNIFEMLKSKNI